MTIKFDTKPSLVKPFEKTDDHSVLLRHVILHHSIARLVVSNNGSPFNSLDWNRLKNIAEGNPDETKIGAFGVGFYSVFSDCDQPFVISGNETMAFYWKGNALFTKKGRIPQRQPGSDTAFVLDYRSSDSPIPPLFSLCQFLSTSLTFVALERLELWLDGWRLLTLSKSLTTAVPVLSPKDMSLKTKGRLMSVTSLTNRLGQIDANYLNVIGWTPSHTIIDKQETPTEKSGFRHFLSRLANSALKAKDGIREASKEEEALQQAIFNDPLGTSEASITIRLTTAGIKTDCGKNLAHELERATKKAPPSQPSIAMLTIPHNEQSPITLVSGRASKKATSLFASVVPKDGKIFIGFRTAQTTGFHAHISAPSLIPTVERENIDLSAKNVSTWNCELLRVIGIVLRVGYSLDFSSLNEKYLNIGESEEASVMPGNAKNTAISAANHTIQSYTKRESTPSHLVADLIEEAFWDANSQSIEVLSTKGVLPSRQVRVAAETLDFLINIPILPDATLKENPVFFQTLYERGMISDVTLKDIKDDLSSQALSEGQAEILLKWAATKLSSMEIDQKGLTNIFSVVIIALNLPRLGIAQGTILPLADIVFFVNNSGIPPECPIPPSTAPFSLTKGLSRHQLLTFGWSELQFAPWIQFLLSESRGIPEPYRLETSPEFAGKVLQALSRSWETCKEKHEIIELLSHRTVIPTKQGLKIPSAAYFPSVKLFDDLPVIKGLQGVKEKFLLALGVRKTVELNVVFSRLMAGPAEADDSSSNKWSHIDLIKYLSSVRVDIPNSDMEKLRHIKIWPTESTKPGNHNRPLHKISELYEPTDELKSLQLPILEWRGNFRADGQEGVFLNTLGLQKFPSVPQLVKIMVDARCRNDSILWDRAMKYFLENYHRHGYSTFDMGKVNKERFVPLSNRTFSDMSAPSDCFTNERASILGYNILRRDLYGHAYKLGVKADPPIKSVAEQVIRSPAANHTDARLVFEYFSGRIQEIDAKLAEMLGKSNIVPVRILKGSDMSSRDTYSVRHTSPRMCFLGDPAVYGKILDFVDFGPLGNAFLTKVGASREPGVLDLAQILVNNPERLLETLGQHKYLELLRKIAEDISSLRENATLWNRLKNTPALLGYRDVLDSSRTKVMHQKAESKESEKLMEEMSEDEDLHVREWSLSHPCSLVVIDSIEDYTIFRNTLLAAPQEEDLELLYTALGTPALSSLVKSTRRVGPPQRDQSAAKDLHGLIKERCRIFLHDHASNKIKHDMKWIEKYLQVDKVQYISLHKKLVAYGATHSERVTACLEKNSITRMYILSFTHKYDLYEVSQALIHELLKRYKQQDIMALEVILGSDLRKLKMRGYNIERILRQRELESRIAADRQQRLLSDQVHGQSEEKDQNATVSNADETSKPNMPGSFDVESSKHNGAHLGSQEESRPEVKSNRSTNKFMSELSKRLGLNEAGNRSSTKLIEKFKETSSTGKPEALAQNLVSAIRSSRAHDSNTMFSTPRTATIPEAEKGAYCDSSEGHDLIFCNVASNGMKVFVTRRNTAQAQFIQSQSPALDQFSRILLICAEVFELEKSSLNIFYSTGTKSIAFNYNGSLFCNFHFFSELHQPGFAAATAEAQTEAAIYWFVVLCHELAHNLVSAHDSKHSFYTESFVQQYFSKMARAASRAY